MAAASLSAFPGCLLDNRTITLYKKTAALQVFPQENGHPRLGLFIDLTPGSQLEICGEGFTQKTVQVRVEGRYYYVLRNSILSNGNRSIDQPLPHNPWARKFSLRT
jgi:hypothetical protein